MNYHIYNFLICVPLPTTVLLFLQCLAFRFKIPWATHGSLDISFPWLFSEPFSSWTSFLVFSAGEFYPSMFCCGNWECPKSSSPSPPSHFFFSRQINVAISRCIIQIEWTFSFKLVILSNWKLGKGNVHSIFQS